MDIQKHMERAREAARKRNFDYAVALYNQVLALKPDFGEARAELREVLLKKHEYSRTSPLAARLSALPHYLGVMIARLGRNKEALIRACERYLQADPANRPVAFLLGSTLEAAGHLKSAVAVYTFLGERGGGGTNALKRAGFLKYRMKDIQGALALYEKVLSMDPRDAEAEKMRKNLAAEGTLATSSYSTARSSLDLVKEKEEAAHLQRAARIHKTEEEIEAEIAHFTKVLTENPGERRALRELGELYVRKKDFDAARAQFDRLLETDPDSFELRCRRGDLEIMECKEEIRKLEDRLEQEDRPGIREDLRALKRELLDRQAREYAWRVEAHPTDLGLRFEYGKLAFRRGEMEKAIEAFQHAVKDPRYKAASMHLLGQAFLKRGLHDLAVKQLEGALEEGGGISEKTKPVAYDLGRVYEAMQDPARALEWYLKVFEIDINFKDVRDKIDTLKKDIQNRS